MDGETLWQQLLAAADEADRRAILAANAPLPFDFFRALKERVRQQVEEDSEEALRWADVGREAAAFAAEPRGAAYARWARGNALLFLGRHDECLAEYAASIALLRDDDRSGEVAQLQTNSMLPLMDTGSYAEAQALGQAALDVIATEGDSRPLANLLLNLGICALRQGDPAGGLAYVERAAAVFDALADPLQAARCAVTRAVALEGLDRLAEAQSTLHAALEVLAAHGAHLSWGRAALNLGVLHARLGRIQAALTWLAQSREAFVDAGVAMDAAVADLYRVQCFVDANLLPEALALGRELVDQFAALGMPRQQAVAASFLAECHLRQGQSAAAGRELARARLLFEAEQDATAVALVDLRRAALLQASGQAGEALRLAEEAAAALDVRCHPLRHAEAHLVVAGCCEDLGLIAEAQLAYSVAWVAGSHPTGATEPPPALASRICYSRGVIAEAAGDRALARGEYGRALGYLERVNRGMGLDELRGGYLADKRPLYEAALRLALRDGRLDDFWHDSEQARAGALRDVLAGRSTQPLSGDGQDEALAELKARWAWRSDRLRRSALDESAEPAADPAGPAAQLGELATLERALADAYRRRRLADPRFAVLEQGEVLELAALRRALRADEALLAFDHVDDDLLVLVVTPERAEVLALGSLAALRWEAAGLGHALEEVNLFSDPGDLARLQATLLEDLQALYRAVLAEPLARLGAPLPRLWVVPCDVLRTLPLEALHDGRQHLVERTELSYLPSASVLAALPRGRDAAAAPPLIVAHSWEGRLLLVPVEARQIMQALRQCPAGPPLLLAESAATGAALRAHAGSAGLVHIATHGVFRADAPLFSTLHLADGPLTVNEVYELDFSRAALVTLSGCQTGLGQGRGGEVLGLAQACFVAGAPTLVVSRWPVNDALAASLMADFYAALVQGQSIAGAMRTAQRRALASYPHAGYWAPFAVWGRGFDKILPGDGGKMAVNRV